MLENFFFFFKSDACELNQKKSFNTLLQPALYSTKNTTVLEHIIVLQRVSTCKK